jgi:isopropylmalate/homocitrate/citramalate synthase
VTERLFPASQALTSLIAFGPQPNKAIVGRNAFAHEAGIHQDGVLKDRRTYEIMRPEDVGVPRSTLVLGKHSGRHAVARRCEELGLTLSRFELDRVYRDMIALADRQKSVDDGDLAVIVASVKRPGSALRLVERGGGDEKRRRVPIRPRVPQAAPPVAARKAAPRIAEPAPPPAERGYGHGV